MNPRPGPHTSILNLIAATKEEKSVPFLPTGLGPDLEEAEVPYYHDPVVNWAEERARQKAAASRRDFIKTVAVAAATSSVCAAAMAGWQRYKLDFQTDFSESNPGLLWQALDKGALFIERFQGRNSGVPEGPHLLRPSAAMADSQALLLATVDKRPADFILRGHSQSDCYRLRIEKRPQANTNDTLLAVEVFKRRKGKDTRVWPAGNTQAGPIRFRQAMATVEVEMDGDRFAVWLRKPLTGYILGIPRFEGMEKTLLAHWTDGEFRDGLLGVWGPWERASRSIEDFRVFSVGLRA
ncbi:MAG: hypothetical protein R2762_13300 [Bryobacteraceae bacterium]